MGQASSAPRAPWTAERTLWIARWGGAVFAVIQAFLYVPGPDSRPYAQAATFAIGGLLAGANLVLWMTLRRRFVPRILAALAFGVDFAAISAIVWIYLDNPDAVQWVLLLIVQLEAAYRWDLRGAIGSAVASSLVYTVARATAAREFGFVLTADSLTFVIGISAIQAVVVGGMARRMRRERDVSLELYETALALNSGLDRDAILRGVVREAGRLSRARTAIIWVPSAEGFNPAASVGLPADRSASIRLAAADPVFGESSVGAAYTGRRTVRLPDGADGTGLAPQEKALLPDGCRSVVSVPIVQDGTPLGVLSCYLESPQGARPEDAAGLQALAALGAVAISNAQALERERSALETMRTLDALKDDFISNVSHELRTPLTVVQGFATTLASRWLELDDTVRMDLVRRIESQARELHERIGDLLDFSRLQSGAVELHPERFDLAEFARETVNRLEPSLAPRRTVVDAAGPVWCYADQSATAQILENLLVNAARYSAPDTSIWVRAVAAGTSAEISVRDEGIGIPADEQERIFERFYRGRRDEIRKIRGTGIGLAIVKELTEGLGGEVAVESSPGAGSTFTVRLPATESDAPEATTALGAAGPRRT